MQNQNGLDFILVIDHKMKKDLVAGRAGQNLYKRQSDIQFCLLFSRIENRKKSHQVLRRFAWDKNGVLLVPELLVVVSHQSDESVINS